jgi:hypothetical protein
MAQQQQQQQQQQHEEKRERRRKRLAYLRRRFAPPNTAWKSVATQFLAYLTAGTLPARDFFFTPFGNLAFATYID